MIRNLAYFLAGLIVAIGISGRTADLLLEYGQCRFGQAKSGTYYVDSLNHHNYLTPRCASVGFADKFGTSSIGYRIAFISTGAVEGRDNVAPMNDGISDPEPCSSEHFANCHSQFGGAGRLEGISLSLTKDWNLGGSWWTRGEVGLLFFKHYFNGYAKPMDFDGSRVVNIGEIGGTSAKWEGKGLDQKSSFFSNPSPLVGMSVGYKRFYVAARYHFPAEHREGLSITDQSFTQLTAGVAIKL